MTTSGWDWYRTVYLKSNRWRLLRFFRRILDRNCCRQCKRRPGFDKRTGERVWLETHHSTYQWTVEGYDHFFRELAVLETLCNRCHDKAPHKGRDA